MESEEQYTKRCNELLKLWQFNLKLTARRLERENNG